MRPGGLRTAPHAALPSAGRIGVSALAVLASLLLAMTAGTTSARAATSSGAAFVPLDPVRVVDSRIGLGIPGPLQPGAPMTFAVAGTHGIPGDAIAVAGNLTVVGQSRSGYVSLAPEPVAAPGTSTLNVPYGDIRANGVIAPLGGGGRLSVTANSMQTQVVFDVTGYFVPPAAGGSTWTPLSPARILDTRFGLGLGGPFAANVPRTFQVAGSGGVPADAVAVTANVTITGQTGAGYVAVTRTPVASPATSTVNFPIRDDRANNIVAPLGPNGTLSASFRGNGATQLIVDVTGYFRSTTDGAGFVPVAPVRVLDSRSGQGVAGPFRPGVPATLDVASGGAVPADALAVVGNLTVTGQATRGYAAVTPLPTATPTTSTLNFPAGDTRANGFVAPTDSHGSIALVSVNSSSQLVLDVTGYFEGARPPVAGATFTAPAAGSTVDVPAASATIAWTESGQVTARALAEWTAPATAADCSNVAWAQGPWLAPAGATFDVSGLAPATCYRFVLTLNGDPATSVTSGSLRTVGQPFGGMQLFRASAWSQQATSTWCTAASTQMMLNLITGASDHSSSNQSTYMSYAVSHSQYVAQGGGAEIDGWANTLTHFGAGTYAAVAPPSFDAAVKEAATRMRITGKPVGLVVMEGHHAWVMAGFTSTGGDPATTQAFTVTSVTVMAPDYPLIAYDPAPGSQLSIATLATKLTPYTDDFPTSWDGGYAIIEP